MTSTYNLYILYTQLQILGEAASFQDNSGQLDMLELRDALYSLSFGSKRMQL